MRPDAVSIIVPVHNEEKSLKSFAPELADFAKKHGFEIILVDDGSTDKSRELIQESELRCIIHTAKRGYGAAIKSGVKEAGRPWVLFIDGDGSYRLDDALRITEACDGDAATAGARDNLYDAALHVRLGRHFLTAVFNWIARTRIRDINSGLRLVRKDFFKRYVSVLPDGFSLSTTLTILAVKTGAGIKFIPIEMHKRAGRSKVHLISDGLKLLVLMLRAVTLLEPLVLFMPASVAFICISAVYGLAAALRKGIVVHVGTLLFFVSGIILFVLGLICDQISSLRMDELKKD